MKLVNDRHPPDHPHVPADPASDFAHASYGTPYGGEQSPYGAAPYDPYAYASYGHAQQAGYDAYSRPYEPYAQQYDPYQQPAYEQQSYAYAHGSQLPPHETDFAYGAPAGNGFGHEYDSMQWGPETGTFSTTGWDTGTWGYGEATDGHGTTYTTGAFDTAGYPAHPSPPDHSHDTGAYGTTAGYGHFDSWNPGDTGTEWQTGGWATQAHETGHGTFGHQGVDPLTDTGSEWGHATETWSTAAWDTGSWSTAGWGTTSEWETGSEWPTQHWAPQQQAAPHPAEDLGGEQPDTARQFADAPTDTAHLTTSDVAAHSPEEHTDDAHDPYATSAHAGDAPPDDEQPPALPHGRGRRRSPKPRRSALLTVAVPSVAVVGVAGAAAATVMGGDDPEPTTQAAPDPANAQPPSANKKLDTQLADVSADADDFAGRASRTQERIDLKERQEAERKRKEREAARKEAMRPKFFIPVEDNTLSAYYGQAGVNWMSVHTGIDFPVSYGTPVMAATDGTVTTKYDLSYGNMAIVTAADGTETWYCHLSSTKIRSGEVKAGDTIAYSGSSGNVTGPHLHFETRPGGGSAVDPLGWLQSKGLDIS